MAVIAQDGRLTLTGYVGEHIEMDGEVWIDGFTHPMVIAALGDIDDAAPLTVHINSGGGIATDGAAIRSALAERTGRTDVVIDGIAASAASLIAMVGETVTMSEGSTLMIHDAAGMTFGTADDHERSLRALNSISNTYARVYAKKSGKTDAECRTIMKAETWFTPDEAVATGFADAADDAKSSNVAAFPYQTYAHAPQKLVALARENGWRQPAVRPAATAATKAAPSAAETSQEKDKVMTDKTKADDNTAELERLRAENATLQSAADARANADAIMSLEEAKGRELQAKALADANVTASAAKVILAAAPVAETTKADPVADYEASRANGAGLGGDTTPAKPASSLVAKAKARYATPK